MELVVFIGLQASGKTTFFVERFLRSHVYLSLDVLKTRPREKRLFEACLASRTMVVVDNTNPTREDRRKYVEPAKAAGYAVHAYFFQSRLADCVLRNQKRTGEQQVPEVALRRTSGLLQMPSKDEGFDRRFFVSVMQGGGFLVEDWRDEVR